MTGLPEAGGYGLLEAVAGRYEQALSNAPQVLAYLRARGIGEEIRRRFRIGYAPGGNLLWRTFPAGRRKALETLDLIRYAKGRLEGYDRFYKRLMFPVRDLRGRVLGFGGRALEEGAAAKYINSSDHPVFRKGQTVYGLYERSQAGVGSAACVVVEGYMDVISLAQHGLDGAVAPLGTALSAAQLEWLFGRGMTEITLCFDGDAAGRAAAKRSFERLLPALTKGRRLKVADLPGGYDPDSFVRAFGAQAFGKAAASAAGPAEYLVRRCAEDVPEGFRRGTAEARAALFSQVKERWLRLPPGSPVREAVSRELARRIRLGAGRVSELLAADAPRGPARRRGDRIHTLCRNLARCLVHRPDLARTSPLPALPGVDDPAWSLLARLHRRASAQPDLPAEALLAEAQRGDAGQIRLAGDDGSFRMLDAAAQEREWRDGLRRLRRQIDLQSRADAVEDGPAPGGA